ncbi:DUF1592 domain-containing protein [Haliea sp. E17]|uniref:DUF1592 domain-containing protein n=1 Tax=Haliea sp. E17 TaxID=3401576 RepID=UPI003AB05A74
MTSVYRACSRAAAGLLAAAALLATLAGCGSDSTDLAVREPAPVGGPALLRRLTESQYRATVADIFGPETPVVARFERALRADGLVAVGTSEAGMSAFAVEQYDSAAQGVADYIFAAERRASILSCSPPPDAPFDRDCAREFITQYGPRLFRRPLSEEQVGRYLTAAELGAQTLGSFYSGLKYALVGMMTAPQFLLRIERAEADPEHPGLHRLDDWSAATRLSYFLTNSTPDRELLRAAGNGELRDREGLERQVDRLIAAPRFESAVRAFFQDMLEFDLFADLAKDSEIYPAFNSEVAADAQEQTLRDIVTLLVEEQGDYRDLFTARETWMTRDLGVVYRQPVASRDGWERLPLSYDGRRRGIQSHISFLALHAHPGRSSPTLRGEAIRNVFLCQEVPDPPANIDFSVIQNPSPDNMPTARDRLSAHNNQPACSGCHKVMDPVGLALENYDGLGSYRSSEYGALIDASGFLDGMAYSDSAGLAQALHDHPETPRCAVEKIYRFAVGRDTEWDERAYMDYLVAAFAAGGYRLPQLMRAIALSENFFAITPRGAAVELAQSAAEGRKGHE